MTIHKVNLNIDRDLEAKKAAHDFAGAVHAGDARALVDAAEALDTLASSRYWAAAMRAVAKAPCPSDDFRERLLDLWISLGDHIRQEVNNDLILCDALRSMLPRYPGPALTLYRGDSALNRRLRTYGLSWSADRDTARGFAMKMWRTFVGGSVLLEATAPPEAVICAPALLGDRYCGEEEYIVDRRRLSAVKVLERFSQVSIGESRAGRA